MPLTNLQLPQGYVGPGTTAYPVNANPGGATIFVLASIGVDNRGRLTFPGTAASTTQSNSAQGPYGDPNKPLASVFGTNGALSYCQAGRGDLIVVLPGHTETVGSAVAVPAGVTILGMGYAGNRPAFTLNTATSANILMSGAGARIQNCLFDGTGFAGVVSIITMTATSQLVECHLIQASSSNQATSAVTISAANCLIANTLIDATAAAGAAQAILAGAASARLRVLGCQIIGNFSVANMVSASTNHLTDMLIQNNVFVQRNGTAKNIFNFTTSSTGIVANNTLNGTTWSTAADAIANSSSTSLRWMQNFGFDDGAGVVSGVLVPAAGTIS